MRIFLQRDKSGSKALCFAYIYIWFHIRYAPSMNHKGQPVFLRNMNTENGSAFSLKSVARIAINIGFTEASQNPHGIPISIQAIPYGHYFVRSLSKYIVDRIIRVGRCKKSDHQDQRQSILSAKATCKFAKKVTT